MPPITHAALARFCGAKRGRQDPAPPICAIADDDRPLSSGRGIGRAPRPRLSSTAPKPCELQWRATALVALHSRDDSYREAQYPRRRWRLLREDTESGTTMITAEFAGGAAA
jgi:hypothetical protein